MTVMHNLLSYTRLRASYLLVRFWNRTDGYSVDCWRFQKICASKPSAAASVSANRPTPDQDKDGAIVSNIGRYLDEFWDVVLTLRSWSASYACCLIYTWFALCPTSLPKVSVLECSKNYYVNINKFKQQIWVQNRNLCKKKTIARSVFAGVHLVSVRSAVRRSIWASEQFGRHQRTHSRLRKSLDSKRRPTDAGGRRKNPLAIRP